MASCLTFFVPSWNRMVAILNSIAMVMTSYLALSVPRQKIIALDRITAVMASCLTLFVPNWSRIVVILDRVVMTMAN